MVKENNISNSIVIKNDKGGLSKNEIEEAKQRQEKKHVLEICLQQLYLKKIIKKK